MRRLMVLIGVLFVGVGGAAWLAAGAARAAAQPEGITTGLVSWWSMDEAAGTRADSHGSNHLTDYNTVGQSTGVISTAADFVRVNSEYLRVGTASLSPGAAGFSVAGWVDVHDTDAYWNYIFLRGSSTSAGGGSLEWYLRGASAGISLHIADELLALNGVSIAGVLPTPGLTFIAAGLDESNEILFLRVNTTTVTATHTTGINDFGSYFYIGSQASGNNPLDGSVDEAAFWNRPLTSADLDWLYNDGAGRSYSDLNYTPPPTATATPATSFNVTVTALLPTPEYNTITTTLPSGSVGAVEMRVTAGEAVTIVGIGALLLVGVVMWLHTASREALIKWTR